MYKISPELLEAIRKSYKSEDLRRLSVKAGISIESLRNSIDQKSVQPITLAKIAGVFNYDFKNSHVFTADPELKSGSGRNSMKEYVRDPELISLLKFRIDTLIGLSNKSEDLFFRSKFSLCCTLETYRKFIRENRMTVDKYDKLLKRVAELETSLQPKD